MTSQHEDRVRADAAGDPLADRPADPRALIEETDWASLEHAYGPAEDTPFRLMELLHEDPDTRAEALGQLDMSVLHQGSVYSSTPPAALFVAAILGHPRTESRHESSYPWDDRSRPLRAALLEWLGLVAESAAYGEGPGEERDLVVTDDYDEGAVLEACRAVRPALYGVVADYLDDSEDGVREAALGAAIALLKAPELADRTQPVARLLQQRLAAGGERRERAATVLTLGGWGYDTVPLLDDPDPAVRACAALAPGCADDERATRELREALLDPAAADSWFDEPLPQVEGWFRFTLLAALIERTGTFEEMLPAALALVPMASDFTVERDWGPLLVKAFPGGYVQDAALTGAQREFLSALADNNECWGNIANKALWLDDVGLPQDRAGIRRILEARH